MTKRPRASRQPKEAPKGPLKKPRPVWFVTLMAFVLPGSGQVFNGAPTRGVIMQFGMVFGAFITYMLTTPDISPVGRMAGGLLVYVFSIVDANGIAKLRVKAWERIEAGEPPRPRKGMKQAGVEDNPSGARRKGAVVPKGEKGVRSASPPSERGEPSSPEPTRTDPAEPVSGAEAPGATQGATSRKTAAAEHPTD